MKNPFCFVGFYYIIEEIKFQRKNECFMTLERQRDRRKIMEYIEKKRLLFFGLPWTFTKYTVGEEVITVNSGFFNSEENDCFLYKVQDVKLTMTLIERMFGLGTVVCYTGDVTNPKLELVHIRNAKEIKNYILETSEQERRRRRTLNTQDIGAEAELDDEF